MPCVACPLVESKFLRDAILACCCGTYFSCKQGYRVTRPVVSWRVLTFRRYLLPAYVGHHVPYPPLYEKQKYDEVAELNIQSLGSLRSAEWVVPHRRFRTTYRSHFKGQERWKFLTDVSAQPVGSIFTDQERVKEISYRRFETTYRSHFKGQERWKFLTDVSGQPVGPIFTDQERVEEIFYRRFETTYRSHLQGSRASGGNFLPTFRNNLSVPSSKFKLHCVTF